MKCSGMKFTWGRSEVLTSVVKWSEGLSNRVSNFIRIYTDHMRFAAYMAVSLITCFSYSFGSILYHLYMVVCFICFCLIF